jgi:hypothetical protein
VTLWDYLDRVGQRRAKLKLERPIDTRLLANVIGCALISGFLGALFALFIVPIPTGNEQIVTYMIGQLSGFAGGIVAYHYTLTAGTKELEAKRADNTAKAFDAIKAAAEAQPGALDVKPDVTLQPGETAQAAGGKDDADPDRSNG